MKLKRQCHYQRKARRTGSSATAVEVPPNAPIAEVDGTSAAERGTVDLIGLLTALRPYFETVARG